jgi:type VI secretion system secreted protein Hcp
MADIYAFLELEGIEGESQDKDYKNKIEVLSFSFGGTNSSSFASGTGSGIAKGTFSEITCMKFADKASLKLFERSINGKPINSGKLSLLKLSGDTKVAYLVVELTNVVVTSFQISGSSDGTLPTESFSLSFVQIRAHYQPQGNQGDPAGNVDFGWNLQQNASA